MFAYEPPIDPPCDEWYQYLLPENCKERIEEICQDILKKGKNTRFDRIYDALYELVEDEIQTEHLEKIY